MASGVNRLRELIGEDNTKKTKKNNENNQTSSKTSSKAEVLEKNKALAAKRTNPRTAPSSVKNNSGTVSNTNSKTNATTVRTNPRTKHTSDSSGTVNSAGGVNRLRELIGSADMREANKTIEERHSGVFTLDKDTNKFTRKTNTDAVFDSDEREKMRLKSERSKLNSDIYKIQNELINGKYSGDEYKRKYNEMENLKKRLSSVNTQYEMAGYDDYLDDRYDNNFLGRFRANYTQGRLGQDSSAAWNDYLNNPTMDNKQKAEYIDEVAGRFSNNNLTALIQDGWISKSAANYIPQLIDQTKAQAKGALAGAAIGAGSALAIGALVPTPEEIVTVPAAVGKGIKAGMVAGSGKYSYDNMRGAAYKNLMDLGVDESIARAAANDEALISSLIEMGDTVGDIFLLGIGGLIDNVGKIGVKATARAVAKEGAEQAAESSIKKVLKALGKYGLNVASEAAQEGSQEIISIANEKRATAGNTGKIDLVKNSVKQGLNLNSSEKERVIENAVEGAKVAAMFGGAEMAATGIANRAVEAHNNNIYNGFGQRISQSDTVDDVIQTGLESGIDTESYRLAKELQAKKEAGEEISDTEIGRLHNENIKTIKAEEKAQNEINVSDNEFAADNKNVAVNGAEQAESGYMGRSAEYTARAQAEYDKNAKSVRIADALNGMGENGKKAMAQFYKGDGNFSGYYNGFSRFYNAGLTNTPIERVNTAYARNISSDIQYAAYMAGKNDAKLSLERDINTATVYNKVGGVIQNEYSEQLSAEDYGFYDALGKATGTKIRFNGKLSGNVNGVYSKGIIDISTDADRPLYVVAKHEITHSLQMTAPKPYREYRNYTVQLAVKYTEGATETSIIEKYKRAYAEQGVNLTTEEAMDEIAADFTEYILTDEATLRQFINDHVNDKNKRNVAQRFFDSVRNFINKVKSIFKGNKAAVDEATVNEFGATVAELEKAEKLWKDALKTTNENVKRAQQNKTSEVSENIDNIQEFVLDEGDAATRFSLVADKKLINFLENQEYIVTYKSMQLIGGKLYPPMSAEDKSTNGKKQLRPASQLGKWQQADENPNAIKKFAKGGYGVFTLYKGNGKSVDAAYNPYEHSSNLVLNDQFEEAYKRPNLVTVECHIPVSEMTSNYHAEYAKDGTGIHDWKAGAVAKNLKNNPRKVYLTRWLKPVRILSDAEVAAKYKEVLGDKIPVPFNVVSPSLLSELEKVGVEIDYEGSPMYRSIQKKRSAKNDTKFSIKDSNGNQLTEEQAEFFKDSKVRDENGNLKVMYHGTPNGTFTQFRTGTYFTDMQWYADVYKEQGASSLSYKKTADNPSVYEVYLNIKKPFDTRNPKEREIFNNEFYRQWGTGTPLMESGLPDWVDGMDLQEFLEENGYDYDGLILDEGGVPDGNGGVKSRGLSYVVFSPKQVKNTDNLNPTDDPDIRFSLKKPVEETKNLLALHNLTEEKLKKSLQLGGFPMPSIAVTKADIPHTNFGDITLVMNKSTIDPKANKKNTVYSADAWTPTFPSIEYEADPKVQSRINKKYYDLARKIGYDAVKPLYDYVNDVERKLAYSGGEQGMIDSLKDNTDMMNLYLADSGQEQIKPVEKSIVTRLDDDTIEKYEYLIKGLGKDVILDLKAKPDESPMTHRKAWLAEHGEELRKVNEEYLRGFGLTDEEIKNVMENPMYSNAKLLTELRGVLGYIANGAETTRTEIDGTATKEAIRKATNKKAYEQWLTDLFAGIEKSTGIYNNKDLFTSNGNRRSFKQTHYPVTLENIVKAMAGQKDGNTKNVSGFHGVKSLRAGTAERFKSIADMHKREGRLQHLTEAQAEAINNALSDRLYDIINRIDEAAILGESNSFIRADTIGDVLVEIAEKGKYTVDSIVKSFAEYGKIYKINNALAADIRDLLFDVSQMPVNIFEAKPERVVGFDEVLAAVVPDNTDTDFINQLKDVGLNVLTYKQNDEQSRLETVNSVEGASFSLKGTDDILKENEKLKKQNEYLKSQMKLTTEYRVNQKQLEKLTRKFIKEANSSIDKKELFDRLNSLYTYMENTEQPVYEDVKAQAVDIAKDIISQSVIRNDEFYDNYQELKKYLRNTRITVSETDRANFPDGYNNFRKSAMGRLNLVNDGTSIDKVYQELDSLFPEYFDAEQYITAADQAQNIIDVLNMFKAYDMSPDSYYVEQSAEYLANDIIESYFDVPRQQPTFADRQAAKLEKQKYKDAVKYNRLKEQKNAELADKELAMQMHEGAKTARAERLKNAEIESIKEQSKNRLKELRKQRDKAIKKVKTEQKEKEARMSERKKKSVYMAKIRKHINKMNKSLFKATDKNHILEPLQRPVTEFLSSINLATDNMSFKSIKQIYALQEAYKEIIESKDSNLLNVDPDLLDNLNDVIAALNKADVEVVNKTNNEVTINGYNQKQVFPHSADTGIRVADMSSKDIISLYHAVLAVERSISTANKIFSENKYESISNWAEEISIETETKKSRKGRKIEAFRIDLENPYTFFGHFGDAGKAIYRMLRNAQDKQQSMTSEVAELAAKIVDRKKVRQWEREVHTFTTEHGKKLTLTTDQCMEIRLLAKRKEGYTHLTGKGVFQPEVKVGKTKVYRSTSAVLLTDADLKAISDSLTKEQIEVSDKLQSIMQTTLADYGNAASMEAYGYTKFNDPNYWPIKVASESIKSEPEKGEHNTRSIKNIGLAKNLTPEAKNPVNINGAFKTFANHAADMIDYAAWLCPMEDANRLFNYQFRDDNGITHIDDNMQGLIERVAGNGARAYWERLMEDIQNGINQTKDSAFIEPVNKIIGNAKGAAVGGNIRVVIQQPTAVFRAAVVLKPQYMMKGLMSKGGWKTALKYSPIAQRKDMGGFDISSPAQMKEILFDDKSGLQRFNDSMTWGAGKADAITWGKIWKACEYQIKDEQPGLKGDEFYIAVNDLFTEVIDQSQVVDGVLQRSQTMRSGNSFVKQATAFMGEPIMSLNMIVRAYDNFVNETDGKKRTAARKVLGRTVMALAVTNMVNALAQSLIDAARDDDDDDYWKKFWEAFAGVDDDEEYESAWDKAWSAVLNGNMISGINPVGYVPFVKDILTMFQGYDVTRADADAINNVISASKMFIDSVSGEGKRTIPYATKNLVHQVSKVFGISATNILRDVWGLARTIAYESGSIEVQYEMEKAIYKIDNTSNKGRFIDILYRAYEQNDRTAFDHIIQDMIDQGIPASDIQSGLSSRAKKAGLTPDDMNNSTIKAGLNLKYEEEEKEKDYSIDDLSGREYLMYASENEDIIKGIMSDFESMGFGTLDEETANDLLRAAYTYANETALEDASGGEYEIDKDWVIAAQTAPDMLDMSLGEYLMLRDEYGDSAVSSSGIFKAYDAGIEPELYLESHDATKNMKGDPVKVNGIIQYKSDGTIKYVPYSKQNKIKDYLNTLNLTQDEYDALFELLK